MQARVASGVVDEGLRTTQLPAAMAGATLFAASVSGKFQGTIAPVTPIGRRTTRPVSLMSARFTCSPWILSARSANQAMLSAKRSASIFDSISVLPCSRVSVAANLVGLARGGLDGLPFDDHRRHPETPPRIWSRRFS